MSRAYVEIRRLACMLSRLIEELPEDGPTPADVRDLRRVLSGLHAVLRLHFAQEDDRTCPCSSLRSDLSGLGGSCGHER